MCGISLLLLLLLLLLLAVVVVPFLCAWFLVFFFFQAVMAPQMACVSDSVPQDVNMMELG